MHTEEKIYFRENLNVKCSSTAIAYSYLEGRVDKRELFSIDGKRITIGDIFLQDNTVRKIIREHGNPKELFSQEQQKFDSFSERYKLFKKIVLRGNDSLRLLLFELDEKKEQFLKLQKELQSNKNLLTCCQKANENLVLAAQNTIQNLQSFAAIIESQKRNLDPRADLFASYMDSLSIIKTLENDLCNKLKDNIGTTDVSDLVHDIKTIQEVSIINDYKEKTESFLAKQKADLADNIDLQKKKIQEERDSLEQRKKNALQAIEDARKEFKQFRDEAWKKIEKQEKEAIDKITVKTEELRCLMTVNGIQKESIQREAKKVFVPLSEEYVRRCHVSPFIPENLLYSFIKKCYGGEVAAKSVLAVFDCTTIMNGPAGVLVSDQYFYLFDSQTEIRYLLNNGNKITTEFKKTHWQIFYIGIGIISVALAIITQRFWPLLGVFGFLVASFCNPGYFTIVYNGEDIIKFPGHVDNGLKEYCDAIAELGNAMRTSATCYTTAEITKI